MLKSFSQDKLFDNSDKNKNILKKYPINKYKHLLIIYFILFYKYLKEILFMRLIIF